MWIAKFRLKHEGDIFTERTSKFNINFLGYPVTTYAKNKKQYFIVNGFLDGEMKNKKQFIKNLKSDKRVKSIEEKNDYVILLIQYSETEINKTDMQTFYNPSIIHLEPVLNSKDGYEYWTIGSFEKEDLMQTIQSAQKLHKGKLISIENKKSEGLFIIGIQPHISAMQKKVMKLAFKENYYTYPRQIEIIRIAKQLKIS